MASCVKGVELGIEEEGLGAESSGGVGFEEEERVTAPLKMEEC